MLSYKTLNEDVELKPNKYNKYDIQIRNDDYVNVTGLESLSNAIHIAIMTRYNEIKNKVYSEFGCHVHELIKGNKTEMQRYKLEVSIEETLENMRRIEEVNFIKILDGGVKEYQVEFSVTSIDDKVVTGKVDL